MDSESWVWVAPEAAFDANPMIVVEAQGESIIVCKIAGKYYAVEDRCSHDDGQLDQGEVNGKEITCPRHGARFDLTTGAALAMPAVAPIRTYPVKCDADGVWVGVEL